MFHFHEQFSLNEVFALPLCHLNIKSFHQSFHPIIYVVVVFTEAYCPRPRLSKIMVCRVFLAGQQPLFVYSRLVTADCGQFSGSRSLCPFLWPLFIFRLDIYSADIKNIDKKACTRKLLLLFEPLITKKLVFVFDLPPVHSPFDAPLHDRQLLTCHICSFYDNQETHVRHTGKIHMLSLNKCIQRSSFTQKQFISLSSTSIRAEAFFYLIKPT